MFEQYLASPLAPSHSAPAQSINALNFGRVFGGLRTEPKPQPFITVRKFTAWAKRLVKSGQNIASGGNPKYAIKRRCGHVGKDSLIKSMLATLTSTSSLRCYRGETCPQCHSPPRLSLKVTLVVMASCDCISDGLRPKYMM